MRAHIIEDLDGCLALAEAHREPVELLGGDAAADQFVMVLSELVRRFGPPEPPEWTVRHRHELGLPVGMVAVWDFDYYQVSLHLVRESGPVLLAWHTSA